MTESEVPRTTDDEEIRALWARACDAWTDGDAHAYGETFTADLDCVILRTIGPSVAADFEGSHSPDPRPPPRPTYGGLHGPRGAGPQ
jgi:hypothetical protein